MQIFQWQFMSPEAHSLTHVPHHTYRRLVRAALLSMGSNMGEVLLTNKLVGVNSVLRDELYRLVWPKRAVTTTLRMLCQRKKNTSTLTI